MKRKELSLLLAKKNTESTNLRKSIEELTELSLELQHKINKPRKNNKSKIIKEIADVQIRLWYLKDKYGNDEINKAIDNKLKSLKNVNIRRHSH